MFGHLLGWYTIYEIHFRGLLPPDGILPGAPAKLRHGTRNGITELSQRVPLIFGRAAITLGIGPHSSYYNKTVIRLLIKHNQHFYLDVSVSARDLHLVQFFFQFLP